MNRRQTKRSQRPASIQTLLKAVPYRNEVLKVTRKRDGGVLASVPMRRPKPLVPPLSWILPYSPERRVELDALGAGVLDLCDGRRNVESIVEKFAGEHKLSFREAQLCITRFLGELSQRGLVAIVGLDKDANKS